MSESIALCNSIGSEIPVGHTQVPQRQCQLNDQQIAYGIAHCLINAILQVLECVERPQRAIRIERLAQLGVVHVQVLNKPLILLLDQILGFLTECYLFYVQKNLTMSMSLINSSSRVNALFRVHSLQSKHQCPIFWPRDANI